MLKAYLLLSQYVAYKSHKCYNVIYKTQMILIAEDGIMALDGHRGAVLLPQQKKILEQVGYQIRMVRQRRKISVNLVAERAGVSRRSVWAVERGNPSVSIGIYLKVLHAVGFDKDLLKICADDPLGRLLQDERDNKYAREEDGQR